MPAPNITLYTAGREWNRHSYDATVSNRDLWETYLPAFKALIEEANVREVMCAYNAYEGQPCCGSDLLLTDICVIGGDTTEWWFRIVGPSTTFL